MILNFLKRGFRQLCLRQAHVLDLPLPHCVSSHGWVMWPNSLRPDSAVYSFGVGNCVGWDLEMIRRFGVTVHAFDPTPASIDWVARQRVPPNFIFHDYGLSNFDGELEFHPPRRRGNTHFSQVRRGGMFGRSFPVLGQVRRLSSILRALGHQRIDLLKIDVEGSEFDAIPDLISSEIEVDQLLIEIHYHFRSKSMRKGLDLIEQIKTYGMRCFHVSPRGLEFSFIHCSLVEQSLAASCTLRAA